MSQCGQPGEGLNGARIVATDQHPIVHLQIGDGGAFSEELGIGEHRATWACTVSAVRTCRATGHGRPRQRSTNVTWMRGQ